MMASVCRMFPRNWLPSPSPFDAPLTSPAMSTISTVAGTMRPGWTISASLVSRSSGTVMTPTLGSMVQNGKLAACALALLKQLKRVDLPTLGSPTMPHCNAISFISVYSCKITNVLAIGKRKMEKTEKPPGFSRIADGLYAKLFDISSVTRLLRVFSD